MVLAQIRSHISAQQADALYSRDRVYLGLLMVLVRLARLCEKHDLCRDPNPACTARIATWKTACYCSLWIGQNRYSNDQSRCDLSSSCADSLVLYVNRCSIIGALELVDAGELTA